MSRIRLSAAGVVAALVLTAPVADVAAAAPAATALGPRYDADGDGVTDRVELRADGTTAIVLSSGTTGSAFTLGTGADAENRPKDIVPVGNIYGTAAPDLLALWPNGELAAYEAAGTNGTTYRTVIGYGWRMFNKILSPGDVTRDGQSDLLGRTPSGDLYLYRSTPGAPAPFATRIRVGGGWQVYDQLVGTGDVDGDRIGDIVARTLTGDLYFYKGTGASTGAPFKARVKVGHGYQIYNQLIAADDLNADGRADFLARTPDGAVYRYLASGGGGFAARQTYGTGGQHVSLYSGGGGVPLYGKGELLTIDRSYDHYLRPALANGRFGAPVLNDSSFQESFEGTLSSALDASGRAQKVEVEPGHLFADGLGWISDSPVWNGYTSIVGPGDLTGDGKGDLLGLGFDGVLYLHRNRSEEVVGTAALNTRVRVGGGWNVYSTLVSGGDHSGDSLPDLIARRGDGKLYLYKGTGSVSAPFTAPVLVGSGWNTYTHLASPGDLTGDGRADLVAVDAAGDVYRYAATGRSATETFAPRVKIASGWQNYALIY